MVAEGRSTASAFVVPQGLSGIDEIDWGANVELNDTKAHKKVEYLKRSAKCTQERCEDYLLLGRSGGQAEQSLILSRFTRSIPPSPSKGTTRTALFPDMCAACSVSRACPASRRGLGHGGLKRVAIKRFGFTSVPISIQYEICIIKARYGWIQSCKFPGWVSRTLGRTHPGFAQNCFSQDAKSDESACVHVLCSRR